MELTEIRITLGSPDELPLCGYCSVTFDHCFVVHDLRILKQNDRLFVAMPSRKRMVACPLCHQKNAVQSRYCNNCGRGLKSTGGSGPDTAGRLYNDIAHPVNSEFRDLLEQAILREYREAVAEIENERIQNLKRPSVSGRKPFDPDKSSATTKSSAPTDENGASKGPRAHERESNPGPPPSPPHFMKTPQIDTATNPTNEVEP